MRGLAAAFRQQARNLHDAGHRMGVATPEGMWEGAQADAFYRRMEDLQHLAHWSLPNQFSALADDLDREAARVAEAQRDWDRNVQRVRAIAHDAVQRGEDAFDTVRRHLPRLF